MRYGTDDNLDDVFRLCVDLQDRLHEANARRQSPVLDFTFAVTQREQAWENIGAAEPKHTKTWCLLDVGLNTLRLSGRLATDKYVSWRRSLYIPFLERSETDMGAYIDNARKQDESMLEALSKPAATKLPSLLAHFGVPDRPIH
jgi:hypothetical protein